MYRLDRDMFKTKTFVTDQAHAVLFYFSPEFCNILLTTDIYLLGYYLFPSPKSQLIWIMKVVYLKSGVVPSKIVRTSNS